MEIAATVVIITTADLVVAMTN